MEQKMEEIIAKRKKNVVQISITEVNYRTTIPIEPGCSIKDIFPILQRKMKVKHQHLNKNSIFL